MYKLLIERRSLEFLEDLKKQKKQYVQIASKLFSLSRNPYPQDCKKIKGESREFLRVDVGEFRIVYTVEGDTVKVILIGKRGDDEVYRRLRNL